MEFYAEVLFFTPPAEAAIRKFSFQTLTTVSKAEIMLPCNPKYVFQLYIYS